MPTKSSAIPAPVETKNKSVEPACLSSVSCSDPDATLDVSAKAYAIDPASVGMARNPTPTIPKVNRVAAKLPAKRPERFSSLARCFNIRHTVPIEGNGRGEDNKKHDQIRKKRANAHIDVSEIQAPGM
jgi:hypothetical protein